MQFLVAPLDFLALGDIVGDPGDIGTLLPQEGIPVSFHPDPASISAPHAILQSMTRIACSLCNEVKARFTFPGERLGASAVINIGTGPKPLENSPTGVSKGYCPSNMPAITSISRPFEAIFDLVVAPSL